MLRGVTLNNKLVPEFRQTSLNFTKILRLYKISFEINLIRFIKSIHQRTNFYFFRNRQKSALLFIRLTSKVTCKEAKSAFIEHLFTYLMP